MTVRRKTSKSEPRTYDVERKEETIRKLKLGMQQLRRHKEHQEGKPITKYKLSKHTGVSIRTIGKYQEIIEILSKEKNPGILLKSAVIRVEKIYTMEEALSVINQLTDLYNGTKDKYNDGLKKNTALNLENVRFKSQIVELNRQLNKVLEKNRD